MHWIIQNNLFSELQWDVLLDTIKRFNISYSEHKVVPFVGDLIPEPQLKTKNVICIGSYSMRHVAKRNNWYPGVFDIYDQNFEVQRSHWGEDMLNYDSVVVKFKDVKFDDDVKFIRPITDSKTFSGKVFEKKDFEDWQYKVCTLSEGYGSTLTSDTLVQVAQATNLYAEYRFWIVKNKIVTYSMYRRGGKSVFSSEVDQRFIDYVNRMISIWSPHETFVIDVADTKYGIKIVEPNTLNASGFYAGNIQKLIFELENKYSE